MRVIWFLVLLGKVKFIGMLLTVLYFFVRKGKKVPCILSVISELILLVVIGIGTFHNTSFTHPILSMLGAFVMGLIGSFSSLFVAIGGLEDQDEENIDQIVKVD